MGATEVEDVSMPDEVRLLATCPQVSACCPAPCLCHTFLGSQLQYLLFAYHWCASSMCIMLPHIAEGLPGC